MAICGNTKLTVPSSFDAVTLGDQVGLSVPSRTRDWCVTQLALGSGLCPPPELHHLGLSTKLSKTFLRIYSQNSLCKFKAFKVEESGRHFVRTIFLSVYKISKYFDRTGQLQHLWGGGSRYVPTADLATCQLGIPFLTTQTSQTPYIIQDPPSYKGPFFFFSLNYPYNFGHLSCKL